MRAASNGLYGQSVINAKLHALRVAIQSTSSKSHHLLQREYSDQLTSVFLVTPRHDPGLATSAPSLPAHAITMHTPVSPSEPSLTAIVQTHPQQNSLPANPRPQTTPEVALSSCSDGKLAVGRLRPPQLLRKRKGLIGMSLRLAVGISGSTIIMFSNTRGDGGFCGLFR
jgi:hypothetical protein